MSTVGIRDLKAHLGRYIRRAAKGETITVTERGTPVAMLVPMPSDRSAIENLKRAGRIRGQGADPVDLHVKIKRKSRRDPDLAGAVSEGRNR